ncbi:MAG: GDSL family lipase [Candidatus Magnetoglobus multicellularis str. Araruama]|uniref:GDSL family lipase n=1 Tax=Candidatus Magnetoglobus multicellularis str. Araruama TaxID=890399 RepID=A0A1V1NWE1_9BACT|nr:MAG: GDSL family lipase [Candidatus Magnetoglobus multicellularis str. Araruama]
MFFLLIIPTSAFALKYKHIVAFGDSLSDHYNLNNYVSEARESMTNGKVWLEYLSQELNVSLDNNAFIGAMTSKHLKDEIQAACDLGQIPQQLGLIGQVEQFIKESHDINADETLFSIWIGSNNLIRYGRGEFGNITPEQMIALAMEDVGVAISKLLEIGATDFIIMNLPDIGKSPWYGSGTPEEVAAATQLAFGYNHALLQTVNLLLKDKPGINLYCFDMVQIMNEIVEKEIFPNTTGTYTVLDEGGFPTDETNGPAENYLFWDGVHPTTKAHEYFAKVVAIRLLHDGYFFLKTELDNAVQQERMKWDLKNDNLIGLEEAIHALKVCSEMK